MGSHIDVFDKESALQGIEVASKKFEEPDLVDGGYGWVVVFSTFLLIFSSYGLNSGFGIYFSYYIENDVFKGASRLDYAFVGGISFGIGMSFSPVINYIQGKIGIRATLLVGNCFQLASLLLASFSVSLWQLYLTQGLLQSIGLGLIGLPSLTLVSQWFTKRRVLATLIATAGSGAGGLVFNLGTQAIIDSNGVRWALRANAILSFGLVFIAVLLVRTRSKEKSISFTFVDWDYVKCPGAWLMCFYLITCMLGYVIIMYSIANFTVSLGYSPYQGSIASAAVQIGFIFGRPLAGFMSDLYGPVTVTTIAYYISSLFAFAMWIPARNYATVILLALIQGLFNSTIFPTSAPIIARIAGISKLNICFSTLWIFVGLPSIFAQAIVAKLSSGEAHDPSLYTNPAIFAGCTFFTCATSALLLRGYLIARDSKIEISKENHNVDLLKIEVSSVEIISHCISWPEKPSTRLSILKDLNK